MYSVWIGWCSKNGYFDFPLAYDNVDWFVDEVIKLENEMAVLFKKTKKVIIVCEKGEGIYTSYNICQFCQKEIIVDKVGDHCHLTGK